MAKKIGEASGYTGSAVLNRSVIGNVQKGSYGLPGDSDKKSRYHQTLSRPATFGDYFKDAKDKFGKLKKMASKIEGMPKSPELANERTNLAPMKKLDPKKLTGLLGNTGLASKDIKSMSTKSSSTAGNTELAKKSLQSPMTPEEVEKARPKGNIESKQETNSVNSSVSSRVEADVYGTPQLSPTEGSDYRFNLKPGTTRTTSGMSAIEGNAELGRRNFRNQQVERNNDWEEGGLIGKVTDQTEVEGIGDSGVFQKSDAYGKAMMRSGLYQKSYNAKKYK